MTVQYFLLDSDATGYAAALTALATYDANKVNFTPTQTVRTGTGTIVMVKAHVTEVELNGDADLADFRLTNGVHVPTQLCQGRLMSLAQLRAFGFHLLGESVRSSEGVAGRSLVFVRQNVEDAGTQYGAGDGSTPFSATHGPQDNTINGGVNEHHQPGTTYAYLGNIFQVNDGTYSTSQGRIDFDKDGNAANHTRIRMDYEADPGAMFQLAVKQKVSSLPMAVYSGNCYVQGDYHQLQGLGSLGVPNTMLVAGYSPTLSSTALEDRVVLSQATDLANCIARPTTQHVMGDGSFSDLTATQVWRYDAGTDSYTDITAAFNDATANDVEFPASPAAGDKIYIGYSEPVSVLAVNVGTAGVGTYTVAKKYWNGAAEVVYTDVVDDSNNLKNTGTRLIRFNPKADQAQQTVNSVAAHYVILEMESGTITTPPAITQGWLRQGALFVHLHNGDNAANFEILQYSRHGYHWTPNSTGTRLGGLHLVNCTIIGCGEVHKMVLPSAARGGYEGNTPLEVRWLGTRFLLGGNFFQNGSMDLWEIGKSTDGTIPWDTSDRPTYDTAVGMQRIVDKWGSDAALFTAEAVSRWSEISYAKNGPHYSQATGAPTLAGPPTAWPISGLLGRKTGTSYRGIDNVTGNPDKHFIAIRGNFTPPAVNTWSEIYSEDGHAHIHPYLVGDTSNAVPIAGGNNSCTNLVIQDTVCSGMGGEANNAGLFGIGLGGDSDNMLRDNGNGVVDVTIRRCAMHNLVRGTEEVIGIRHGWDQNFTIEGLSFIGCYIGIATGGGGNNFEERLHVVVEESGVGFTDQTVNNYNAATFNAMPASPGAGDRIWFGRKRDSFRNVRPNIITSGVGSGLTGKWRHLQSGTTLVDIPTTGTWSDAISDFTAAMGDRTLEFDRPGTWSPSDFGGELPGNYYWICFEITAGTYSVLPQITSTDGPRHGGYFVQDVADKMEFLDMEGPWLWIGGLNGFYGSDGRLVVLDRVTGRLKPGETIATRQIVWRQTSGEPSKYTLAQVKAGQFDKARATTDVWEDNVGRLFANVSETPGVDIMEVA